MLTIIVLVDNKQIDVMDLILNCLTEHEKKLSHLIEKLENIIINEVNPEELKKYGVISIHDKRGTIWGNYGNIIKMNYGVNGLEFSTDRGYIVCFSFSCHDKALSTEREWCEE
ncbi:MAG: hypothetical protein NWE89_05220 [Candidatus Bathyarchaeota archaeon]|nr:hypothetical protein [Candidatus Bathyarchaeota archaeon]